MRGVTASGFAVAPGSFLVRAGTPVSQTVTNSFRDSSEGRRRAAFEADGTIRDGRFTRDVEFKSPSGAGGMIVGNPVNGRTCWRTADGLMFADVFPK